MAKHNRNPNIRKKRVWGKNVGDPNKDQSGKSASGGKKGRAKE